GDDGTTWAGWQAGASYYLPKPFDVDHLLTWVDRLIEIRGIDLALADVAMTVDTAPAD
ncbi:MAG: DNA-binding response regulator, partial [Rhodoferax sp.]|nr:DNA-binding response regulator [Actinomycetota bacterium]